MGQIRTTTLVLVLILAIAAASPTRAENVLRWASTTEALNLLFEKHGKLPVESMQFRGGDHAAAAVAL